MKRYWTLLIAGLFLIGIFTSCDNDDDEHSLNDVWVGMGVINKTGLGNNEYNITLDDNSILFPVASDYQYNNLTNGERVIAYFTILGEKTNTTSQTQYYVKIRALKDVLTKGIFLITPAKEDSIGNDPIHVNDVWLTNNYLNFEMQYYGGNMIHYINLVKDNNAQNPTGTPIKLQLRHNNKSDSGHFPLKALVSFDLSSLKQEGKSSVDIEITGRDFDGQTFTKTITYKYNDVVALKKAVQPKLPSFDNLRYRYQQVN